MSIDPTSYSKRLGFSKLKACSNQRKCDIFKHIHTYSNIVSELYGVKYLYTYKELYKCQVFVIFVPFTFRGRDTTPPPNFFWITNGFFPWTVEFSWKNCCFAIHFPARSITPTARRRAPGGRKAGSQKAKPSSARIPEASGDRRCFCGVDPNKTMQI